MSVPAWLRVVCLIDATRSPTKRAALESALGVIDDLPLPPGSEPCDPYLASLALERLIALVGGLSRGHRRVLLGAYLERARGMSPRAVRDFFRSKVERDGWWQRFADPACAESRTIVNVLSHHALDIHLRDGDSPIAPGMWRIDPRFTRALRWRHNGRAYPRIERALVGAARDPARLVAVLVLPRAGVARARAGVCGRIACAWWFPSVTAALLELPAPGRVGFLVVDALFRWRPDEAIPPHDRSGIIGAYLFEASIARLGGA